jgi:hypothetical protein
MPSARLNTSGGAPINPAKSSVLASSFGKDTCACGGEGVASSISAGPFEL